GGEEARHSEPPGQRPRGGGGDDHVLRQPKQEGADGLCDVGRGEAPDRVGSDGGGVQGDRQAASLRLRDEVEGAGSGGRIERAVPDLHEGALVAVLEQDRPIWVSGGCMRIVDGTLKLTSFRGQTRQATGDRHWLVRQLSSHSATLSQLPCLGV